MRKHYSLLNDVVEQSNGDLSGFTEREASDEKSFTFFLPICLSVREVQREREKDERLPRGPWQPLHRKRGNPKEEWVGANVQQM